MTRDERIAVIRRAVEGGYFGENVGWGPGTPGRKARELLALAADLVGQPLDYGEAEALLCWAVYRHHEIRPEPRDRKLGETSIGRSVLRELFGFPERLP